MCITGWVEAGFRSADLKDKGVIKQTERYKEAQKAEEINSYQWSDIPISISNLMIAEAEKIIKGGNQNYYFVDSVEPSFGEKIKPLGCGFVAILREVRAISRELALQLLNGIDEQKINEIQKTDPTAFQLSIDKDSFCIPTGELSSPFIEQLMQNFSLLFGRVGTADISNSYSIEIGKLFGSKA